MDALQEMFPTLSLAVIQSAFAEGGHSSKLMHCSSSCDNYKSMLGTLYVVSLPSELWGAAYIATISRATVFFDCVYHLVGSFLFSV